MRFYKPVILIFAFLLVQTAFGQTPADIPEVVSTDTDRPLPEEVREMVRRSGETKPAPTQAKKKTPATKTENQTKMLFYLDLLTKTEGRASGLRKSLFDIIEKENKVKSQLRNIQYSLRPEQIRNSVALSGSMRPEQLRDERVRMMQEDQKNLNALMSQIQANRSRLENTLRSADTLVDRVRARFEYFVNLALDEDIQGL